MSHKYSKSHQNAVTFLILTWVVKKAHFDLFFEK